MTNFNETHQVKLSMGSTSELVVGDLNLTFSRRKSSSWECKKSEAKYKQRLIAYGTTFGTIYLQGSCIDESGKEISLLQLGNLIEQYGEKAVDFIDGSFVLAVDDIRSGIWCATDYSASYPLYYNLNSDTLDITNRPENIKINGLEDLDLEGVTTFINSGHPWGELTLVKSWKVLRPGQILRITKNDIASISYYFNPEIDESIEGFESPAELLKEIDRSLLSIASLYKKILIPLSGGVDSRLIAVQCHKLGIPFETITFVADEREGDDFAVASQLAKVLNVKHHRWDWSPSSDCVNNFTELCISSAGSNDAFTSYPDAMKQFAKVASDYDCVIRGDHSFGFGGNSQSAYDSALALNLNFKDDLSRIYKPSYQGSINLESVFVKQEELDPREKNGQVANAWRHTSFRKTRSPRFLLAIGQIQAQHANIAYPFLSKKMIKRMARTNSALRDEKVIASQALRLASPEKISRIPMATESTWQRGEPLLNLPSEVTNEMAEIIGKPSIISEVIDESLIKHQYFSLLERLKENGTKPSLGMEVKSLLKKVLPKQFIMAYRESVSYPKVSPHLLFKRHFALKVFLNAIEKHGKS